MQSLWIPRKFSSSIEIYLSESVSIKSVTNVWRLNELYITFPETKPTGQQTPQHLWLLIIVHLTRQRNIKISWESGALNKSNFRFKTFWIQEKVSTDSCYDKRRERETNKWHHIISCKRGAVMQQRWECDRNRVVPGSHTSHSREITVMANLEITEKRFYWTCKAKLMNTFSFTVKERLFVLNNLQSH